MNADLFTGEGVVLRVGELYLKGGNRRLFLNALLANIRRAIVDRTDVRIHTGQGRVFLAGAADTDLLFRMRWVFGLSSYSKVVFCERSIEAITETAVRLARQFSGTDSTCFRIAARRSDKSFPYSSAVMNTQVGSAVNVATGYGVNLTRPDLSIGIEVGTDWCFLWTERIPGGGGLPVGTAGRVMLLLSGGIDSPVAGHLLQKRGVALSCMYFHAFPYTSDGAKEKVVQLAKVLATRQKSLVLHVIPFAAVQERIRDAASADYLVILYRRMMVRIAQALSARLHIAALATGENLGQVASQTLENMSLVEEAVDLPVLRPLLTADKFETIQMARDIRSFDISIQPFDDCCTLFVPQHPQTRGRMSLVKRYESRLDIEDCVASALNGIETITL